MDTIQIAKTESEQLSYRTKDALLEWIQEQGDEPFKLPNEEELSQKLGVSRNVLRDALTTLEGMGVVTRRRSKGTIATPKVAKASCRLDTCPELMRLISEAGFTAHMETLRMGYVFEPEPVFPNEEMYLNVEKLFFANNIPVALCIDHIPGSYTENVGKKIMDLRSINLHEFLEESCGTKMAYTLVNVEAVLAKDEVKDALKPDEEEPLLFLDDEAYNYDHKLIAHSYMYLRSKLLKPKFLRKSR